MNLKDLKPLSAISRNNGVKLLAYGDAGSGKTPLILTAPRPVVLVCENGAMSVRNSNIPCWVGDTVERIDEFFKWFAESSETKNFDTLCIDSVSQMAEIYLDREKTLSKDGRRQYGQMIDKVMPHINAAYYKQNMHLYMIGKMTNLEVGQKLVRENNMMVVQPIMQKQPMFSGQTLGQRIKHLMDEILYVGKFTPQGYAEQTAFLCKGSNETYYARDRSGNLSEAEPADLTALFKKCSL